MIVVSLVRAPAGMSSWIRLSADTTVPPCGPIVADTAGPSGSPAGFTAPIISVVSGKVCTSDSVCLQDARVMAKAITAIQYH
ncbi:hypothetical protein D3C78_1421510 [compost metagenome]